MDEKKIVAKIIGLINFPLDIAEPKKTLIKKLSIEIAAVSNTSTTIIKQKLRQFYKGSKMSKKDYEQIFFELDPNAQFLSSLSLTRGNSVPSKKIIFFISEKVFFLLKNLNGGRHSLDEKLLSDFFYNCFYSKNSALKKRSIILFSDFVEAFDDYLDNKKEKNLDDLVKALYQICPKIDFRDGRVFN
jgi:hypothetical protein